MIPAAKIVKLLFDLAHLDPAADDQADPQMLSYTIQELIAALEESGECTVETIAKLQFTYLPLFRFSDRQKPMALYEYLNDNPAFS